MVGIGYNTRRKRKRRRGALGNRFLVKLLLVVLVLGVSLVKGRPGGMRRLRARPKVVSRNLISQLGSAKTFFGVQAGGWLYPRIKAWLWPGSTDCNEAGSTSAPPDRQTGASEPCCATPEIGPLPATSVGQTPAVSVAESEGNKEQ